MYAKHAEDFLNEVPNFDDVEARLAFKLLRNDPDARLLLYFHGNTATIAQGRRTEEYRSYSSGASEKIYVLAFDYRGFGRSSGSPSEQGLLNDAEAVIEWALKTTRIPPERIVLLGHSLGTAVVSGVAHHYAKQLGIEFAGLILCAAFTNSGNAFSSYSIGGLIPVLAPVKLSPALQSWFSGRMHDTWRSDDRLADLARKSTMRIKALTLGRWVACTDADEDSGMCLNLQLVFVVAEDDSTMPWDQTEELFKSTLRAATEATSAGDDSVVNLKVVDMGEAGKQEVFWQAGSMRIQKTVAKHGGKRRSDSLRPAAGSNITCYLPAHTLSP